MDKVLNIIKNDPWLEPYADAINGRHQHVVEKEFTGNRNRKRKGTGRKEDVVGFCYRTHVFWSAPHRQGMDLP